VYENGTIFLPFSKFACVPVAEAVIFFGYVGFDDIGISDLFEWN
jgi:hypothetical protein